MRSLLLSLSFVFCCFNFPATKNVFRPNNHPFSKWQLVWSDEFSYSGLPDSTKWAYDTGGDGWGNNELEYYTSKRSENARVENGNLVIEARKESWQGRNYTSARLVTKNKGDEGTRDLAGYLDVGLHYSTKMA